MVLSKPVERSLCLINTENLDSSFQPWTTISDAKFHPSISALYCNSNVNPIQSIQTNYLPPFISYLWPLVYNGVHVWAVDHPTARDTTPIKFVLKYDLLIWDLFYRTKNVHPPINSSTAYPRVLILAPEWFTCEHTYKHLSNADTDVLKTVKTVCIYEGQNVENELYKNLLTQGCDILIATPTIVNDLIQKRYIHFERLQIVVYDQFDLILQNLESINEILNLIRLHKNNIKAVQHFFLSRVVNQTGKHFIHQHFSSDNDYYFLSSSLMESYIYKDFLIYAEPCRNWFERKSIIKDTLDIASRCHKKTVMCAYQTRRLATMHSILNDLSIQSVLIHAQLNSDEIQQHIDEWQTIDDRPFILLIQDDILHDTNIDNADIIIHLDVQRLIWYQLFNQRMKLVSKHIFNNKKVHSIKRSELTSLKLIEKLYHPDSSLDMPLNVMLWPGDCANVTYEFIDYINNSSSCLHPLIERLAKNNCHESFLTKINVQLCPTLKMFGQCSYQKILKRCPYRHCFHYEVDYIEQHAETRNDNHLTDSFELYLPNHGEVELRITHVSDGNRLWAHILRSRTDATQSLVKVFDYDSFYKTVEDAFKHVQNRPLREIVPGEIYLYMDNDQQKVHRVYVYEQEQTYFDIRRVDSILNRLQKYSNVAVPNIENEQEVTKSISTDAEESSSPVMTDRPALVVFSLDTGITFTLKANEHLYPIEPSSLKQYPPLATEIILCNIYPLDKITMTFTPFTIETVRSLTLNEIFMGRIQLATRSCVWIDPLVKPIRLASLKRIAYDKPIRRQLILSKLVQPNDDHMKVLERMAVESNLREPPPSQPNETSECNEQKLVVNESSESIVTTTTEEQNKPNEETSSIFKPFLNRTGQLIISPVGRSKQFFTKHNQQISNLGRIEETSSTEDQIFINESRHALNGAQSTAEQGSHANQNNLLDHEHVLHPFPEYSTRQPSTDDSSSSIDINNVQTVFDVEPKEIVKNDIEKEKESLIHEDETITSEKSTKQDEVDGTDDADQMMFIFGPKLFSQLRQIKHMEDEQRRQADFPVQRNRHRHIRNNNYNVNNSKSNNQDNDDDANNETTTEQTMVHVPNMSRYEPFVGERGPLTQEQIDYKQTQRKTRLFWEQTPRDVYLTIGFYNVDSTQTRVEFKSDSIYCRTKIRAYERFVRIYLLHEIVPERCLFQVRRSNILLTIRKADEGLTWTTLTNRPIEPRPEFFAVEYGSDDESDTEKRRRTINKKWEQLRNDNAQLKTNTDDNKFLIDDMDDDDNQQQPEQSTDKLNIIPNDDDDDNQQDLTDTSSDCHSTDSDDCYYEDQVPANHIPLGYDDADYDHRFYGPHVRS